MKWTHFSLMLRKKLWKSSPQRTYKLTKYNDFFMATSRLLRSLNIHQLVLFLQTVAESFVKKTHIQTLEVETTMSTIIITFRFKFFLGLFILLFLLHLFYQFINWNKIISPIHRVEFLFLLPLALSVRIKIYRISLVCTSLQTFSISSLYELTLADMDT